MNNVLSMDRLLVPLRCRYDVALDRHCTSDITSASKYPDMLGAMDYRETSGSNQVEVQSRV